MFPAYKSEESTQIQQETSKDFLRNPSYNTVPVTSSTVALEISLSSSSDSEGEIKQDAKILQFYKRAPSPPKIEIFYIDRERKKEYLKLNFLPNRAVPFYKISRQFKHFAQPRRKFRRYFKVKRIKKLLEDPLRKLDEKESKEEDMRIHLIKNSDDVEKWIEYIDYKVSENVNELLNV